MILLGERTAVDIAVSNTDAFKRDTFLEDLFQNARKKVNLRQLRLLGINNLEAMLLKFK